MTEKVTGGIVEEGVDNCSQVERVTEMEELSMILILGQDSAEHEHESSPTHSMSRPVCISQSHLRIYIASGVVPDLEENLKPPVEASHREDEASVRTTLVILGESRPGREGVWRIP